MSAPVVAFFNNKSGVGKTSLVYHLAWMYADLGVRVVAADLDPQANLTAAFLDEDRLEELWPEGDHPDTIFGCVQPLVKGIGDIADPHKEWITDQMALLVGDLALAGCEDQFTEVWSRCLDGDERAFRLMSALWRIMQRAAAADQRHGAADVVLMDLGPNLGALNRAALIAADFVVVPLAPDLFSMQGLHNLGPALRRWRQQWRAGLRKNPAVNLALPEARMRTVGYIVLQHAVRLDRPVSAYDRWIARIPEVYRTAVLDEPGNVGISVVDDPYCLALLKHYRSLTPMAQEARKPMFHLKPADGAIGAHLQVVQSAYQDFKRLAQKIAQQTGVTLS